MIIKLSFNNLLIRCLIPSTAIISYLFYQLHFYDSIGNTISTVNILWLTVLVIMPFFSFTTSQTRLKPIPWFSLSSLLVICFWLSIWISSILQLFSIISLTLSAFFIVESFINLLFSTYFWASISLSIRFPRIVVNSKRFRKSSVFLKPHVKSIFSDFIFLLLNLSDNSNTYLMLKEHL